MANIIINSLPTASTIDVRYYSSTAGGSIAGQNLTYFRVI